MENFNRENIAEFNDQLLEIHQNFVPYGITCILTSSTLLYSCIILDYSHGIILEY